MLKRVRTLRWAPLALALVLSFAGSALTAGTPQVQVEDVSAELALLDAGGFEFTQSVKCSPFSCVDVPGACTPPFASWPQRCGAGQDCYCLFCDGRFRCTLPA